MTEDTFTVSGLPFLCTTQLLLHSPKKNIFLSERKTWMIQIKVSFFFFFLFFLSCFSLSCVDPWPYKILNELGFLWMCKVENITQRFLLKLFKLMVVDERFVVLSYRSWIVILFWLKISPPLLWDAYLGSKKAEKSCYEIVNFFGSQRIEWGHILYNIMIIHTNFWSVAGMFN